MFSRAVFFLVLAAVALSNAQIYNITYEYFSDNNCSTLVYSVFIQNGHCSLEFNRTTYGAISAINARYQLDTNPTRISTTADTITAIQTGDMVCA